MKRIILITLLLFALISPAYAIGNLTGIARINITGATIGKSYSMNELAGSYYEVTSYLKDTLRIEMEAVVPVKSQLVSDDFEPIPDIFWIKLEEREFTLNYGEKAVTDIMFTIPDDPKYLGKKFQFNISGRLAGSPYRTAFTTKVLLSISPSRFSVPRLIKELGMDKLEFDLAPRAYSASGIPLGEKIDLSGLTGESFEISNNSDQKYAFKITADDFLFSDESEIVLGPRERKIFHPYVLIPDEKSHRAREFIFTLKAEAIGQLPEQSRSSTITVRTKEN